VTILGGPRSVAAWLAYMDARSLDELEGRSRDEQLSLLEALTPTGAKGGGSFAEISWRRGNSPPPRLLSLAQRKVWRPKAMTPEIEIRGGRRYAFMATPDELEETFAAIDDDVLVEAYEGEWLRLGLEPPALTVDELREQILAIHQAKIERAPREVLLSIAEAAPHLGTSERRLRYRVDSGEFADDLTVTRNGERALRFQPPPRCWLLIPSSLRPDPRVLARLGQECRLRSIAPGQEFAPGYTRRADGENWPEAW
jgi:hypothetical protein